VIKVYFVFFLCDLSTSCKPIGGSNKIMQGFSRVVFWLKQVAIDTIGTYKQVAARCLSVD
jgi:hypothetical protein